MVDRLGEIRAPSARPRRPLPLPLRRRGLLIALGLAALVALGWVMLRPHSQPGRAPRAALPMPVVIDAVQQGDMPVKLVELGTVTPLAMVTVRTQINGQLTQVGFKEGQEISKGDFLAEIDPRPYQAVLDQTR